jgi:hypothetical protein
MDPIGDGGSGLGHLEALAEGPGEALQEWPGQGPQGAVEVLDRLGIEGHLAEVGRGLMVVESGPWPGSGPEPGKQ